MASKKLTKTILTANPDIKRPNFLMVILETFDYSLVKDPAVFTKVMPWLAEKSKEMTSFEEHYSPWPFSSKALYSIICGDYPYPGQVIDLRVRPNINCDGWTTQLAKSGYELWAGYSGDLGYDRMGQFLSHQSIPQVEGRQTLSRFKLEEFGLGVDDKALIFAFKEFLEKKDKTKPFSGVFIPINSHHPYWVPKRGKGTFENKFWESFRYQDQLLEELFVMLKQQGVLDDTIVFITGDHGKREGSGTRPNTIERSLYHIPLFIFNSKAPPTRIQHATSHIDFKGTVMQMAGLSGQYLQDHELFTTKDMMVMYDLDHTSFLLKDKNQQSMMINLDRDESYLGETWVENINTPCTSESQECLLGLQKLKGLLEHAKEKYEDL